MAGSRLGGPRLLLSNLAKRLITAALLVQLALVLPQRTVADNDAGQVHHGDESACVVGRAELAVDLVLGTAALLLRREVLRRFLEVPSSDELAIALDERIEGFVCVMCHCDTFPTQCIFPLTKPVNRSVRGTIPLTTLSDEIYAC